MFWMWFAGFRGGPGKTMPNINGYCVYKMNRILYFDITPRNMPGI